jgi:hypothetical protein
MKKKIQQERSALMMFWLEAYSRSLPMMVYQTEADPPLAMYQKVDILHQQQCFIFQFFFNS